MFDSLIFDHWFFLVYFDLSCALTCFWPQGHVPQDLTMTSKQCNPCTSQYILADIWAGPPASAPSALCEHGPFHLPRTCCTSQAPRSLHFSAGSVFACLIRSTLMYFASGWRNAKPLRKICKNETVQSCSIHSFLTTGFWSILIYLVLLTCFDPRVMFHKTSQWQASSAILVRLNTSWQIFELGHRQALQAPFANMVPFHLPRTCCTSQAPHSLDFSAGSGLCLCDKKYFDVLCLWLT